MAKIVIAEDEPDIRELIAFTLRFAGHEVIAGANGQEGYDLTKQHHPDLSMFDVRMPKMTGYDACKMIKSDPEIANTPVVFLSAKGQENEIEQGLASGADDYLLKPFAPDQLTERVKAVLAKYGK
jgi:DNA-binding response OmpR family regulator